MHKTGMKKPSWNIKRLYREKLAKSLVEARLIKRFNCQKEPTSLKGVVQEARQTTVDACNHSMPRRYQTKARKSAQYWCSDDLAGLRRECNTAQKKCIHSKGYLGKQKYWHKTLA